MDNFSKYATDLLHKFKIFFAFYIQSDGDPILYPSQYKSIIGDLQNLAWTWPDIALHEPSVSIHT